MKKLTIIFILFFVLFLQAHTANAQQAGNNDPFSLFNLGKAVLIQQVKPSNNDQFINVFPFTNIGIKGGSLTEETTLYVFKGNFSVVQSNLPKGQSPIASYYITFKGKGLVNASITKPLTIQVYNNFINTNTYWYPVASNQQIDTANQKEWPGNIKMVADLPVKDVGFIVAVNKWLKEDDPSLNPIIVKTNNLVKPTSKSSVVLQNLGLILIIVVIIFIILILSVFLILKRKQTYV